MFTQRVPGQATCPAQNVGLSLWQQFGTRIARQSATGVRDPMTESRRLRDGTIAIPTFGLNPNRIRPIETRDIENDLLCSTSLIWIDEVRHE